MTREILGQLVDRAGAREVLVVAGDQQRPYGPYRDSLDLLDSGLLEAHGMARVGVAVHPQGHPTASDAELRRYLRAKQAWSDRTGVPVRARTQFVFEVAPVARWYHEVLAEDAPRLEFEVGIPGPLSAATAIKFARRCCDALGIDSFLAAHPTSMEARAEVIDPGATVVGLARLLEEEPSVPLAGLHFYPFGGFRRTAAWINAVTAGRFTLEAGHLGVRQ